MKHGHIDSLDRFVWFRLAFDSTNNDKFKFMGVNSVEGISCILFVFRNNKKVS